MIILTEKDYQELIEENKKLKEEIENHKQNIMQDELEIIPKLEEENKKLKEDVDYWHHRCMVAERGGEDED